MRIRKKIVYVLAITFLLCALLIFIFTSDKLFVNRNSECLSSKLHTPCGIIGIEKKSVLLSAIILRKYKKNEKYFFDATTIDSQKRPLIFSFTFPPGLQGVTINTNTQEGKKIFGSEPVKHVRIEDVYTALPVSSQLNIPIYIPDAKDIAQAKKMGVSSEVISCADYPLNFTNSLKNSNFFSSIRASFIERLHKCPIFVGAFAI